MLATHRVVLVAVATVISCFLIFHTYSDDVPSLKDIVKASSKTSKKSKLRAAVHTLFDSIRHPITDHYTDLSGKVYALDQQPQWTKPLKEKILLVDIDTRVPNGDDQILNPKRMDWENLGLDSGGQLVSNAIFDHYLYAQIHGYEYKFFQAQHIEGYYDTWISPHVLQQLLPDYKFVVTMDADVTITHPEVPLEWLFNHWGITNNTSISLPWDQVEVRGNETLSVDSKGMQVLNTGLMIVQNLDYTMEMLQAWKECPTEKRYPGCAVWKEAWSHEQRAFSEYIRYDFNPDGDNIVPIPCDDAVGLPGMINEYPGRLASDCKGNFFRHHTLDKHKTKASVTASIMQLLFQLIQNDVLETQDELWIQEAKIETFTTDQVSGQSETREQEQPEPVVLAGLLE